jgi:hypothetical protein
MINGSCLCGKVAFRVNGDILAMTNCHCSMCRKLTGAAFGTLAFCKKEDFMYISGENHFSLYRISEQFTRIFCDICGSPLPVEGHEAFGPMVGIPAGLLDDDPIVKPSKHIFVGSKAPWFEIKDNIPQYEEWFPGFNPKSK